jgi:hypothetical protein
MQLLKPVRQNEYPVDFLLARLKGRSERIRIDWQSLRTAADPTALNHPGFMVRHLREHQEDGPWVYLFHEFEWVRNRMNTRLRDTFFPVFLYFELFNLLATLRYKEQGNLVARINSIASYSLLDDSLFDLIRSQRSMERCIDQLAQTFAQIAPSFESAWQAYFQGGFPALERAVHEVFFAYWLKRTRSGTLKTFVQHLVDSTNLLGLYKALQWNVDPLPAPVAGGTLAPKDFIRGFEKGSMDTVVRKAGAGGFLTEQETGTGLESGLFLKLRKILKRNIHEPSGEGYILYYIWENVLFARQYSLILRSPYFHEEFFQAVQFA